MAKLNNRLQPKAFARITTESDEANAVQQETAERVKDISECPILNGLHLVAYLDPGDNSISHKLGRNPRGWLIHDIVGGPPMIWRVSSNDKVLVLHNANANRIGVALWVY